MSTHLSFSDIYASWPAQPLVATALHELSDSLTGPLTGGRVAWILLRRTPSGPQAERQDVEVIGTAT